MKITKAELNKMTKAQILEAIPFETEEQRTEVGKLKKADLIDCILELQEKQEKKDEPKAEKVDNRDAYKADIKELSGEFEITVNSEGHYIIKSEGYLIKLQVSKKGVKVRGNKKFAEASGLDNKVHDGWNVKYEILATYQEALAKLAELIKAPEEQAETAEEAEEQAEG